MLNSRGSAYSSGVQQYCVSELLFLGLEVAAVHVTGIRASVRSAWAGLGAGFLHTLSGPDHLAVSLQSQPLPAPSPRM